jgi:hypothetical protein
MLLPGAAVTPAHQARPSVGSEPIDAQIARICAITSDAVTSREVDQNNQAARRAIIKRSPRHRQSRLQRAGRQAWPYVYAAPAPDTNARYCRRQARELDA